MKCPYCNSQETVSFYRAKIPNILSACHEEQLKNVKIYPFEVEFCSACSLGFNATVLSDAELKTIYDDYLYISPMSGIGCSDYDETIQNIKDYANTEDSIVEIGCSEGYLLDQIRKAGYKNLLGIEPGPQAEIAKEKLGLNVIRGYFDENTKFEMPIDLFVLMHVYEHFNDPFTILDAMKKSLSSSGKIIIEVPFFDGYHHQHLFFYNLDFFERLCKDKKMKIVAYDTQRDTLHIVITHKDNQQYKSVKVPNSLKWSLEKARQSYENFNLTIDRINILLQSNIGKKVYWWGAGSSSVIYLNQIERTLLAQSSLVIIDGDSNKWGRYIPGFDGLRVLSNKTISKQNVDLIIIASSFYQEIKEDMAENDISATFVEII